MAWSDAFKQVTGQLATVLLAAVGLAGQSQVAMGASVANGKYLFEVGDCMGCHAANGNGPTPSGGLGLDTPFGTFRAPNITPDKRFGIGSWSVADFKRALRQGIGKNGEYLYPVFPYPSFSGMTDSDAEDLYAYLMTIPPAAVANRPHEIRAAFAWRPLLFVWRTLFFREGPHQPHADQTDIWNRGNYLVHAVAHCEECHTPRNLLGALQKAQAFAGNVGGPDGQNAPNITSDPQTGIGGWTATDIQRLLRTGMTPDSDMIGSGMKAVVRGTSRLSDADLQAVATYLKTVPPIRSEPAKKMQATNP